MDHHTIPPADGQPVADAYDAARIELTRRVAQLTDRAAAMRAAADQATRDAGLSEGLADVYRGVLDRMPGTPQLPPAAAVQALEGGPGMDIDATRLAPPLGATPDEMHAYQDLMRAINDRSWHEIGRAGEALRQMQGTLSTQEVAPQDRPEPDPLAASPAEETGAHRLVRFAGPDGLPQRSRGEALAQLEAEHPKPDPAQRPVDLCATASCGQPIRGQVPDRARGWAARGWVHVATGAAECEVGNPGGPVAWPASFPAGRAKPDAASANVPYAEHTGHRVDVLTTDRERTRGIVVRVTRTEIVLQVPEGEQTFPMELVQHVARAEGSLPLEAARYGELVGQRVTVCLIDGRATAGVLRKVTPESLFLDWPEGSADGIWLGLVEDVVVAEYPETPAVSSEPVASALAPLEQGTPPEGGEPRG